MLINDKLLHFIVGITTYIFFSYYKFSRKDKLLIVLVIAISKELIDYTGNPNLEESYKDIFATMLGPLMLVRFF